MLKYRFGFVFEHALGHITHAHYIKQAADRDPTVDYEALRVDPNTIKEWRWIPILGKNWNFVGSLAARRCIKAAQCAGNLDLAFIHTQVMGFFSRGLARSMPVVLSMDATPINLDSFGTHFGHWKDDSKFTAKFKKAGNQMMYHWASKIITLNGWAAKSLIKDYGVDPQKVVVIPPAVDVTKWDMHRKPKPAGSPVKILFVGSHFERKGGLTLLKAFAQLPPGTAEMDMVCDAPQCQPPAPYGARYHSRLPTNSPELINLYAEADMFVLPTYADLNCLVLMEALAMRIPVITTDVGGLAEQVTHGVNGFIMERDDVDDLANFMLTLARDPDMRRRMGEAGRAHIVNNFNAAINYPRVLEVLKQTVHTFRAPVAPPKTTSQPLSTGGRPPQPLERALADLPTPPDSQRRNDSRRERPIEPARTR